jgi:hypothetical protein
MLERRKAFEEQREAAKQVERIAPLTRLGTPLTVGAPPARNVAELKPILGNDNATPKTKPKVTALPLRRRAFASQDDVAARNPDTVTLEHAKPVSRVSLDILLSNPVPVQASALSGHIKIRIRKSSAIAKEEPVAVAGEGKVRVVGFGSVAHNGAEEKFVFYQAGGRLKFQTGSVWKEGETGDAEGFGLAREGAHVLPFRLSLPLAGSDGDAKGPSNVHRGVLVRYITMACVSCCMERCTILTDSTNFRTRSIKIKDLRTSKRSIAHFYRTVFIYPRLDSLLLGTSASRLRNGAHRALEASHHFTIQVYRSASSLPSSVWEAFQSSPQDSNIMYPHALKRLIAERNGQPALDDELWIAYWSNQPTPTIDFVLSCTNGPLGTYPVFLFTPHAFTSLTEEFLLPRLAPLVDKLRQEVPTQRVFSVFAPEPVSNVFAKLWTRHTGIQTENEPYYAALISYCTRETFTNRQISSAPDFIYETRLAVASDIPGAARLCWGFASESVCTGVLGPSPIRSNPDTGTFRPDPRACSGRSEASHPKPSVVDPPRGARWRYEIRDCVHYRCHQDLQLGGYYHESLY